MADLVLVTNISTCKEGVCYPVAKSQWSRLDLIKLLQMTGVSGKLPDNINHEDVVKLLLERLNIQRPWVYALRYGHDILLETQTSSLRDGQLHMGPFTKLHHLRKQPTCAETWKVFEKHMRYMAPQIRVSRPVMLSPTRPNPQLEQQRTTETNQLLALYRSQLEQQKKESLDTENKNWTLLQEVQTLRAQLALHEDRVKQLRQSLGEDWSNKLPELLQAKQDLAQCQQLLAEEP